MKKWKSILVSPQTTILETIKIIDDSAMQIAIVVGDNNFLMGTVTDGDIRRGILKNISLDSPVELVMNANPVVAHVNDNPSKTAAIIKAKGYHHIPVVDDNYRIVDIKTLKDLLVHEKKENTVILMAGGLGTRLYPLTDDVPKPLLKVGKKPILETILESFIDYNFYNFYISVNYKSEMIKEYFGDGTKWGVNINYLDEDKRLGTAGALSLLPDQPALPIIVMNGDLLTKINFDQLLNFHLEYSSSATMCVREYNHQVPYGVVRAESHRLIRIEEKPVHSYFVNAGIYVLSPEAFGYIPSNQFYDMPTLFEQLIDRGYETTVFPIREYWIDIGRMSDFEKANIEYAEVFK